jgi:thioredoxin reductase
MKTDNKYDVIIVGGSYAGLSAAMSLGRSRKNVLILDGGLPCNRYTPYSHNFITQDGIVPKEIADKAREQVLKYKTVDLKNSLATEGGKVNDYFEIITDTGEVYNANKLIFATGIKDLLPSIKGFSECWGKTVIHCPYCHGYEFRDKKTGIMIDNEKAFHIAQLVNNLTDKISIITGGKKFLNPEQLKKLKKHNISIIDKEVVEMEQTEGIIKNVVFSDGSKIAFDVIYSSVPFEQNSNIPNQLGCALTDLGYLQVDSFHKTTVEGIFAIGDNSSPMRSVANAVATGNFAGAIVNMELTAERF